MYQVQDWAEVHRLVSREGWSKAEVAEKLGMSRNTVSRLLTLSEPPSYQRPGSGSLLDPFKTSIAAMLDQNPKVPATVMLERLRREGFRGQITILRDWLAEVRPSFVQARSFQRTTYLPGELGQADWWQLGISVPVGKGAWREVFGLVATLPHSAAHAAVFTFSKQVSDFAPALLGCVQRLGGVPEGMVVDRDSAIVIPHSRPPRLHLELAVLFGELRMRAVILRPRHPQGKGQGERTIGYLETSFLPLRTFASVEDLQAQHDRWAGEVAFQRHHRRVGAKVADAWAVERGFLHPLPKTLPDVDRRLEVRVAKDGFVRVADVDYSVPPGLGGRRVGVALSWNEVVISLEGQVISRHRRSYVPADVVLAPAHARALRLARQAAGRLQTADVVVSQPDLSTYDRLLGVDR